MPAAVMVIYLIFVLLLSACLAASGARHPLRMSLVDAALAFLGWAAILTLPGNAKPVRVEMLSSLDGAAISYFEGSESDGEIRIVTGRKWYALPWSERTARALHEASRQAENEGGSFVLREPQDGTPGGEWSAEHRPAEPGPPKG